MLKFHKMLSNDMDHARHLLAEFINGDEHYIDSREAYGHGGDSALQNALELFLHRPELGFVWLAYEKERVVGVCVISYAISTSIGGLVAKLDDVMVESSKRGNGGGSEMIIQLKNALIGEGILQIDTAVH